jgi:ABC-2 type transport system permease protein
MAVLSVANLIALNFLIFPLSGARVDLTQNGEISLSPVTRDVLNTLQEPLLIRGYFSENNHPLLEPLIPRVRDTLEEYKIASNGKLELDFVDPISDPEIEREANQTYGIRPTPLQINNRSGSSIINAYFDILIRYGDQTQILNLLNLIEIDQFGSGDFDLRLKNLEYDLTSSIQRAVLGFQSLDSVFESLTEPAKLTLYITPDSLPQGFEDVQDTITSIASDIETQSNGKFTFEAVDMSDPNTQVTPDSLVEQYQIQPIATSIFSTDSFYLHMVVTVGDKTQVIFPTGELSETEIRNNIEGALKRLSSGFLPVVGVWTPPSTSAQAAQAAQASGQPQSLQAYSTLMNTLGDNYETRPVDLSTGQVPGDIDTADRDRL